jgi:HAE1 family hydrophobic/amphiphilic exporter-1
MNLSRSAVEKPTTWLIIFIVLAITGIYCATMLPIDLMPDMDIPYVACVTTYTGASPEEVERSVTKPLESALSSVSGIKHIHSTSSEGRSVVLLEMNYGVNLDATSNSMRDYIDRVRNKLPTNCDSPLIIKIDPSMMPIMAIGMNGNRTTYELYDMADNTIDPLLQSVEGVSSITIAGGSEESINISVPRNRLEAYNLTLGTISQMIAQQNVDTAAGTITQNGIDYNIQTEGAYKNLQNIKDTVVAYKTVTPTGSTIPQQVTVKLGDIADIVDGHKDRTTDAYIDGKPAVILLVQKSSDANTVVTTKNVNAELKHINSILPPDVKLKPIYQQADDINRAIKSVTDSLWQGGLLCIVILMIFLRSIAATVIISLSIPLAVIVTLLLMYFMGFTLNVMTLAGLALGIGMLVDNSIVILENIFSYTERGAKPTVAAMLGSSEMVAAITGSTLTTVCVFLPMIMLQSQLDVYGQIFGGLAFTVVFSLMCSLGTAIFLVPCLSSHYLVIRNVNKPKPGIFQPINLALGRFFDGMDSGYGKLVKMCLHHKAIWIGIILALFVGSVFLVATGIIPFQIMPDQDSTRVQITVKLPVGTTIGVTEQTCLQLQELGMDNIKGLDSSFFDITSSASMAGGGSYQGTLTFNIATDEERKGHPDYDTAKTTEAKMRKFFPQFPSAKFTVNSSMNSQQTNSSDIDVTVQSTDLAACEKTAYAIRDLIQANCSDILKEIDTDMLDGLPQVNIDIDREKMHHFGITTAQIGTEIEGNVGGITAGQYDKNGNDYDIIVRVAPNDRMSTIDLNNVFVMSSSGQRIRLASFATADPTTGPVQIKRLDQSRTIEVTAKCQDGVPLKTAQTRVQKLIQKNIPADENVRISYTNGNYANMVKYLKVFIAIIALAMLLVFAVMAAQFESFKDPFIILFCIPMSFIGIVTIYLITGEMLSLMSAVGFLILLGVIVNNGIVLVDYTNLLRRRGEPLFDACWHAASNRLRPILMSVLTTVLGLVPMAFATGEGSAMTGPLGKTVLGGLSFGTIMTLFMVPVIYYLFNIRSEKRKIAGTDKARNTFERSFAAEQAVFNGASVTGETVLEPTASETGGENIEVK